LCTSSLTWMASSRVGHRMSTWGPGAWGSIRSMAGMAKAAVLPEPVWDCPTMSRPVISTGMASAWIGEACSNPRRWTALRISSDSPSSENSFVLMLRGKP